MMDFVTGNNTYKYRDGPFDNVQPLPSSISTLPRQAVQNPRRDQIPEGARDERTRVKDGHSEGQLLFRIPLGQVKQDTGEKGSLDETQDEATGNDLPCVANLAGHGGD